MSKSDLTKFLAISDQKRVTGWYMVVFGQYGAETHNLEKVTPTNQSTNRQGEYSAICLFEGLTIEGRFLQQHIFSETLCNNTRQQKDSDPMKKTLIKSICF